MVPDHERSHTCPNNRTKHVAMGLVIGLVLGGVFSLFGMPLETIRACGGGRVLPGQTVILDGRNAHDPALGSDLFQWQIFEDGSGEWLLLDGDLVRVVFNQESTYEVSFIQLGDGGLNTVRCTGYVRVSWIR